MNNLQNKNTMFGLKSFHLQTIEHEASHPQKTHINFVPFARFCEPAHLFEHVQLKATADLLEWAYGYRNHLHSNKRNKRRVPSAGGLYPNEILLIGFVNQQWRLLHYSFEKHAFFWIRDVHEKEAATYFLSDRKKIHFFFISVLWKTVQKYGVRGFRYSLLDAGFIGSHLLQVYKKIARNEKIDLIMGYQPIHNLLPLRKGEEIMFGISLSTNFEMEEKPLIPSSLKIHDNYSSDDTVPCLSTNMIRIADISEKALKSPAIHIHLNHDIFHASVDCFRDIENRLSANGFKDEYAEAHTLEKIKNDFFKCAEQIERVFGIKIHLGCIINKTSRQKDAVEIYFTGSDRRIAHQSDAISQRLQAACQKQTIMHNAAFTFVLFVVPEQVDEWSYFSYSKSILAASFICSELYFSAMKHEIGTTTIGGFSEKQLMEILGKRDILPLVVQAFGITDINRIKIDALITQ